MNQILSIFAQKYTHIKCIQMKYDEVIPNYPEGTKSFNLTSANCPTLLVYRDDEIMLQTIGLKDFGGEMMTLQRLVFMYIHF